MTYRPIPAVGLAAAVLQILDFSINVLRKDNPVYQPSDASIAPVENAPLLQSIVNNLYRLTDAIDNSELKKLQDGSKGKLSEPALQLLKLSEETKEATGPLVDAVISAQARGSFGDPRWGTAREALMNGVWRQKDVTGSKKKLRAIRKDVDVALLLALRQYVDQSAETGLPVFSEESAAMQYWEKWQNEALEAVHTNEWKPKNKKNVEEFTKLVDKLIQTANEAHFCDEMFSRLSFEELDHRLHSIPTPHPGSFEWMFDDAQRNEGGLLEWLGNTRGDNLFWVTGKPGSGKTTAMKYLFRNPDVFDSLEAWSGHAPGITSGFFFWNCGTSLQRSGVGLLRSLLYESLQDMIYGPLEQDHSIVQWLFADRWSQFMSYGGGLYDFSFSELRRSFELMISDLSKKFLFVIDGLDESDDSPVDLLDVIPMLLSATKKDNVKICVSSRMSPAFQEAFDRRPKMLLNELNGRDIHVFVEHFFNQEDALARLADTDRTVIQSIITTLSEKASGVFLWVTLATSFLIYGLPDDSVSLETRADALPQDIEPLLSHILSAFNPTDLEALWKVSVLVEDDGYPSLIPLWHALNTDAASALAAEIKPLEPSKVVAKVTAIRELTTHKCRSFFSVFDTSAPGTAIADTDGEHCKVTYTHRLIRDHLSSSPAQKGKLLAADFNTASAWANAHLLSLKTLSASAPIWPPLAAALECALTLYSQSLIFPLTYVDAALDTALHFHAARALNPPPPLPTPATADAVSADLPSFPSIPLTTPLDLATLLNIPGYTALKAPTAPRKQVRHALDFSRTMRRRLGLGGEVGWLGGPGRERLGVEFGRVRSEGEALLEYYAKAVRFGTAKPWVETPGSS